MTAPAPAVLAAAASPSARRRRPNPRARASRTAYLLLAPFLVVFAVSIVIPLGYALVIGLFKRQLVGGTVFVGLDNYARALGDTLLHDGVLRVLVFLAVQVPIMLVIALLAALAIDSGRLGGSPVVRIGLFLPYAIPAVVAALMWGYIFGGQFGLARQVFGFFGADAPDFLGPGLMLSSIGNVVTWSFVGYNMLIFYASLRSIPTEVYEAAAIDGAGEIRKAWSIKLPALRPALTLALIFSVIGSLQLFNEPSVLQALRPSVITTNYTPNLYAYSLAFSGGQTNYAAAIAVLLGGFTVVIAYVVQLVVARRDRLI
jgi:multiple sugar transport system permease protein